MNIFLSFLKKIKSDQIKHLHITAIALFIISIIYGFYMKQEQPDLTIIDLAYFMVTTSTSIGYGDISPKEQIGRFIGLIYMLFSVGLLALLFSEFATRMQNITLNKRKGFIKMKDAKLLIIGYPSENKMKELITLLRETEDFKTERIVCLNNVLSDKPLWFNDFNIDFKKGIPSDGKILKDISIENIEVALILAQDPNDISSDDSSASALTVIEGLNPKIRTIVEKVREDELLFRISNANVITRVSHPPILVQEITDEGALELEKYIFSANTEGTQQNEIIEEDIIWKDLAIKAIMNNRIPEGFKNPGEKFNFTPITSDIIRKGAIFKYRL